MLVSEVKANARRSLEGKWGKAVLIGLVYIVIVFLMQLIFTMIPVIGPIVNFIITTPISYGIAATFIKLKRGEEVKYTGFLAETFSKFGKVWGVIGHTILKMIIPIILIIVSLGINVLGSMSRILMFAGNSAEASSSAGIAGILLIGTICYVVSIIYCAVKGLLYSLTNYALYDNPEKTSKEIVEESERLMKGNRWKYIWLGISFIGWVILLVLIAELVSNISRIAGVILDASLGIGQLWLAPYMQVATVCFYEALLGKDAREENEEVINDNPISE